MPASVNDFFRRASSGTTRPVVTYLGADKTNGSTTAVLNAATGWNTTTGVDVVIYRIDTSGAIVAGTQTDWIGTLAGSTLSNLLLKAGTEPATGYPAGTQSVVIASPTAAWADSLVEGLLVEHAQDGTHDNTKVMMLAGAQTIAGTKTFSATPVVPNASWGPSKLATGAATATVATSEPTSSTSYADLATVTDTVTVTVGANGLALVSIAATGANSGADGTTSISFAVSGATTIAASVARHTASMRLTTATAAVRYSHTVLVDGLTPGSNTFKMKYLVPAGTGTFSNRTISVVPL
jgi:hypothetical protein